MFEVRIRDQADSTARRLCQWPATKPIEELVSLIRSHDIFTGDETIPAGAGQLETQFVVDDEGEWAYLEIIVAP